MPGPKCTCPECNLTYEGPVPLPAILTCPICDTPFPAPAPRVALKRQPLPADATVQPPAAPTPMPVYAPRHPYALACAVSAIVHVALCVTFLFVHLPEAELGADTSPIFNTEVDDREIPREIEKDEIGIDPTVALPPQNETVSLPEATRDLEPLAPDRGPPVNLPVPRGVPTGVKDGERSADAGEPSKIGEVSALGKPGPRGWYGGRNKRDRLRRLEEGGGNARSEDAVARGLRWLALHQDRNGSWNMRHLGPCTCTGAGQVDTLAGTAFGVLPFLGAGHTHRASPGEEANGQTDPYQEVVEKALKHLVTHQDRGGGYGPDMYTHGVVAIALCEAYGMTADPALRKPAQAAIDYIVKAQTNYGGWSYQPFHARPTVRPAFAWGAPWNTSIGGWQMVALKSGQMAGLNVPPKTFSCAGPRSDRTFAE